MDFGFSAVCRMTKAEELLKLLHTLFSSTSRKTNGTKQNKLKQTTTTTTTTTKRRKEKKQEKKERRKVA